MSQGTSARLHAVPGGVICLDNHVVRLELQLGTIARTHTMLPTLRAWHALGGVRVTAMDNQDLFNRENFALNLRKDFKHWTRDQTACSTREGITRILVALGKGVRLLQSPYRIARIKLDAA